MSDKKFTYKYTTAIGEYGDTFEDAQSFGSNWSTDDPEYIADDAAEYDFYNCDGWENNWPVVFRIWSENGEEIGVFEIEMETEPVFRSSRVKKSGENRHE